MSYLFGYASNEKTGLDLIKYVKLIIMKNRFNSIKLTQGAFKNRTNQIRYIVEKLVFYS